MFYGMSLKFWNCDCVGFKMIYSNFFPEDRQLQLYGSFGAITCGFRVVYAVLIRYLKFYLFILSFVGTLSPSSLQRCEDQ